ncbi:DUF3987 domain-containing protein [Micromonospora inaquosa]
MENVPGAPLLDPITICGDSLRLGVRRHRLFESNLPLTGTPCWHDRQAPPVPVYGSYGQRSGRKRTVDGETSPNTEEARTAMGIDWMPWPNLTQAIPPAYTHWIGVQLMRHHAADETRRRMPPGRDATPAPDGDASTAAADDGCPAGVTQPRHQNDGDGSLLAVVPAAADVTPPAGLRHCHCGNPATPTGHRPVAAPLLPRLPPSRLPHPHPHHRAERRGRMTPARLHLVTTDQQHDTDTPPGNGGPLWDVPVPLTGPSTAPPPFPVDVFPRWLGDMVTGVARFTQTDPAMAGTLAVAVLSACAGGRLEMEPVGGWREPVNIFAAVIAGPGERKSPVHRAMTAPLFAAQSTLGEAMRPRIAEAAALRDIADGWGVLHLTGSTVAVGRDWGDGSDTAEERGLKHRAKAATRDVPVPPPLVRLLDHHVKEYPPGSNGKLFVTRRGPGGRYVPTAGQPIPNNTYGKAWRDARAKVLTPAQQRSPLARRPYDLRHAAVSLWLNAGVPATQVAEWAGHSMHVLMRVYAKCIYGQEEAARKRIEAALRGDYV